MFLPRAQFSICPKSMPSSGSLRSILAMRDCAVHNSAGKIARPYDISMNQDRDSLHSCLIFPMSPSSISGECPRSRTFF